MKHSVVLAAVVFGLTLAWLVAQRLSDQAMAVIVGSIIGVVASVPMTALVLWFMLRQRASAVAPAPPRDTPRYEEPRIVVIQPQAAPVPLAPAQFAAPAYTPSFTRAPREFKIVGEEDLDGGDSAR